MSKEKQIEEMACIMCGNQNICVGEGVEKCILYPQMRRYADRAYRKGYRKQSEAEWISVDERLPESLQRVLAINTEGDMFTAVYISFVTGKNAWSTSYSCLGVVTHWMPLPEPPDMKGGAQ